MKDEIKEILDRFNFVKKEPNKLSYYPEDLLTREEIWLLYDYITNLQESEAYYYGQYKDYKSRNEKAIEYIKDSGITFLNLANQRWFCNNNCADKIINILNGGDEE